MRTVLVLSLALCFSTSAFARCEYPAQVDDMPDGNTATKEEMLAGQKVLKAYLAEMDSFLECLGAEEKALGEEAEGDQLAIIHARHNAAVEAMEQKAELFNVAVRAYKGRAN